MSVRIHYAPLAVQDMDEIWDYISFSLSNVMAANSMIDKLQASIEKLADFPQMGTPLKSIISTGSGYRFLVCESYIVFYREKEEDVYIDRVLYGKRDYLKLLFL